MSVQIGDTVSYVNMSVPDLTAAYHQAGMPEDMAGFLAMTDVEVSNGALFDDRRVLSKIIGRATTPMKDTVAKALA